MTKEEFEKVKFGGNILVNYKHYPALDPYKIESVDLIEGLIEINLNKTGYISEPCFVWVRYENLEIYKDEN